MRQSTLFTKTRKEAPADEVSKNAQLLIRAGFVYKEMAGVYSYLPLGLRTFKKIENIIREEMNAIGGEEVVLTSLQEKSTWEPTNQWDDAQVDVWFKTKLKNDTELGLAVTHEPPLTRLMKDFVHSYRDLPRYVYQFQTKFRNETRAKSGIMRCREFVMKDLYSFSRSKEEHDVFYEKAKQAYINIFSRIGIGEQTFVTFASGGMFAKFSHEFQTITDAGEDIIYVDEEKKIAVNKEVYTDEILSELGLDKSKLVEKKAVETGNIFTLADRFSGALGLNFTDEQGEKKTVFMGSYGIGPGRVMGTVVETLSDDKGIVWPRAIAPFAVHLVELGSADGSVRTEAEKIYNELIAQGVEVLWDDRDLRPGEKFADSDLIGIPTRIVVSEKSLAQGKVEVKNRKTGEVTMLDRASLGATSF
jgi:prolyl-tRNA synthetase